MNISRRLALPLITFAAIVMLGTPLWSATRTWSPAVYHKLTMGKSTRADVLQELGKPSFSGKEEDTGAPILTYEVSKPVPGKLTVYLHKGIVENMTLEPAKDLSKAEAERIFGTNYILVHYDVDDCLAEGDTAPIYEAPSGLIAQLEYRSRGVALVVREKSIQAIAYVSEPFGPEHSVCAGRKKALSDPSHSPASPPKSSAAAERR